MADHRHLAGRGGRRARGGASLLAALMVGVLGACASDSEPGAAPAAKVSVQEDDGLHGALLDEQYVVPRLTLTATDGSSYRLPADLDRPLTLVFFGYTTCPDICAAVMADIASALTRLDPADRERVDMLLVTSDPARDDPATLRAYLDRFDPDFEGVTGDLSRIVQLGNELGVPIEKGARLPSGGYEVAHGTQVIGVTQDGQAPVVWTEGTSAADLAADLTSILRTGVAG